MPDDNKKENKLGTLDLRNTIEDVKPLSEKNFDLLDEPAKVEKPAQKIEKIDIKVEKAPTGPEKEGKTGQEMGQVPARGGIADKKRTDREKAIEKVLESGLRDAFLGMSSEKRQEFAVKGEETARAINELFEKGKATAGKVIDLIKKWLMLIPGMNKFFLEQEAKIKSDEIFKQRDQK